MQFEVVWCCADAEGHNNNIFACSGVSMSHVGVNFWCRNKEIPCETQCLSKTVIHLKTTQTTINVIDLHCQSALLENAAPLQLQQVLGVFQLPSDVETRKQNDQQFGEMNMGCSWHCFVLQWGLRQMGCQL